jgi:inhibitor of KinA sporulation pathway (predicted exonuclease)
MNYMVFDLEFNQGFDFEKNTAAQADPQCPFEIIDIGAVKLDEDLNTIGTFDVLIKPVVYPRLHPFIKQLTGISEESLEAAESFREVYKAFLEFVQDVDVLCVWGTADMKELFRNIEYHKLESSKIPQKYINVQRHAARFLRSTNSHTIGLANAVNLLSIPLETQFHKAFNDAYYTAEVFKRIHNHRIEHKIYNESKERTSGRKKEKKMTLDTKKLIDQFEKMYNRKMTFEEQEIIKLAYKMGSTNQFQK